MRVKFASVVTEGKVDLGLINVTGELDVLAGDEHLHGLKGTGWNKTGAVTRLGAPGDFVGLGVTNGGVRLRGRPEAEVFWMYSSDRGYGKGKSNVLSMLLTKAV